MSEDGFSDLYDEPSMDLFIETLTGTTFEMRVCPSETILDIKRKFTELKVDSREILTAIVTLSYLGIPVHHQNLLFRMEETEDRKKLSDMGIVNGCTLKLVLSMRGGPISTRRLSTCDHHLIWKDLKELIEHTREELGDKLSAGAKVSVLVFKDGDVINLIRVIENDDGSYHPYNEKSSSSPTRLSAREDGQVGFYNKLQENNTMLAKLTELRKKIADVSLKRHFKNSKPVDNEENVSVGCIGEKPSKESEEDFDDPKDDKTNEDSGFRYRLLDQFRKDAHSLLKLHESQFGDDEGEETDSDDLEKALQMYEDSIALKEKHRGKHSFYNMLFQDPLFRSEKLNKSSKTKRSESSTATFARESRERLKNRAASIEPPVRNSTVREKQSEVGRTLPSISKLKQNREQRKEILSPVYSCFSSSSSSSTSSSCSSSSSSSGCIRSHKYDNKINLPDITCDLELTPTPTASSIAESIAIIDEDTENEDKEVMSPIGVPCAGTLSMSKVSTRNGVRLTPLLLQNTTDRPKTSPETVNLEENAQEICDIFTEEAAERFRSNKLGLLKRWQSVDCSSDEVFNPGGSRNSINFKENCESSDFEIVNRNYYLPSLFSASPGAITSHFAPKNDRISDLYFGNRINQDRISRSPLYRRFSQTGTFSSEAGANNTSDNAFHKLDNHKNKFHDLTSTWSGASTADSVHNSDENNSNCDNVLNIQPLTGTLYNILNANNPTLDSSFMENRVELNPLRFRSEEEGKKLADEIKNLCSVSVESEQGKSISKIQVDATKLENLPAIIDKKRMRCGLCNKRLNITNMYDCRCGGIFCAQHRYSEVHHCNYDYKTEGRKILEQQNPVIVADKLNKL